MFRLSANLPDVEVYLYEPKGAPAAKDQPVNTEKPGMTRVRALLIMLMNQYKQLDYALTLLEIHKLAYFLQVIGEPLKLKYKSYHYGPYATNIRFLLEKLEGHYISGYGDNENPEQIVELMPGAIETAQAYIGTDEEARQNLERVASLIEGFETPFGMELLASVHWLADNKHIESEEDMTRELENWSNRKARLFSLTRSRLQWRSCVNESGVFSSYDYAFSYGRRRTCQASRIRSYFIT